MLSHEVIDTVDGIACAVCGVVVVDRERGYRCCAKCCSGGITDRDREGLVSFMIHIVNDRNRNRLLRFACCKLQPAESG